LHLTELIFDIFLLLSMEYNFAM